MKADCGSIGSKLGHYQDMICGVLNIDNSLLHPRLDSRNGCHWLPFKDFLFISTDKNKHKTLEKKFSWKSQRVNRLSLRRKMLTFYLFHESITFKVIANNSKKFWLFSSHHWILKAQNFHRKPFCSAKYQRLRHTAFRIQIKFLNSGVGCPWMSLSMGKQCVRTD